MKKIKIALIWKVIIACALGCLLGRVFPVPVIRIFSTFNYIFSQYIRFIVPLIIVGLVTPAICKMGTGAGKMLLFTIVLAYVSSVFAGLFSYGVGNCVFPALLDGVHMNVDKGAADELAPFFTIDFPPFMSVTSALVFSFLMGTLLTTTGKGYFKNVAYDFEELITKALSKTLIPLLPIYIFGIFLKMSHSGEMLPVLNVFAKIILVITVTSTVWIAVMFCISGIIARKNPIKSLISMLPAYLTAVGTASSAATIPVTLSSARKCGASDAISNFTVPLCATIHMPGSMINITACAITIMMLQGTPFSFPLVLQFILMIAITAVAAPGVPGGVVMASLGVLASVLGFNDSSQALIITLYVVMDSFGTACNVTADGAIALIVDTVFSHRNTRVSED